MQKLFVGLREAGSRFRAREEDDSVINVHRLTERAGTLYEKLRYLVDYKEERHIRRSAIERIIRRKLFFEETSADIGLALIQELIAGGYLANNTIAEGDAGRIDAIITRYRLLQNGWSLSFRESQTAKRFLGNLLGSEIESYFFPRDIEDLTARAFAEGVRGSLKAERLAVSEDALQWQILLSCYRSLFNADDEALRFVFWNTAYPDWNVANEGEVAVIAESSPGAIAGIEDALKHPLGFRLIPKLSNQAIYFSLIYEIIRTYGVEAERVLSDPELLSEFSRAFLGKHYRQQFRKSQNNALRAVLYVFLTKILLAVALEIPYALYVLGGITNYLPLALNIVIHPLLLMTATLPLRPLGERNTKAVIAGVEAVCRGTTLSPIRIKAKEGGFLQSLFLLAYGLLFLIVFSAVISGLRALSFDVINILLFLVFLALVSFFALRIRNGAKKWRVREEDERLSILAFNLLILPIIRVGRWLSRTFSAINVFVFVMDFIIETPFKLILKFSDAFVAFLREKQEDIY